MMQTQYFFSCIVDGRMKTCEKREGDLLIKCLQMKKQLHNKIRSENLIILNSGEIVYVWAS